MLVPKLRFKEFNNNWNNEKISNAFALSSGSTPNTKQRFFYTGNINWVSSGELKRKYIVDTINKVSNIAIEKNNLKIYDIGTLLIAIYGLEASGVRGTCSILNIKATISQACMALESKNNISNEFMYYWYQKNGQWIGLRIAQGTKQQNLTAELIGNLEVEYPSIDEQEKIVNFLSLLDKKIELQKQKIEALKIYKKGLINKLLNSNDTLNWNHIKLNDILLPGSKEKVLDTSKFQKINIKLNLKGLFKNNSNREMADTRPFYIRNVNEIIIGKQNYFNGSIAIVTNDFDGCICSNAIMSFSIKNDNPKFIYYYISQPNYIKKRAFLANGTGQKELSEKEFLNFEIYLPSIEEQNYIVNILDFVESKFNIENSKYEDLKLIKKSLLQQMFI